MAKMRVHELAKELNIKSQDILDKLKNTKFDGKSASSNMEDEAQALIRGAFAKETKSAADAKNRKLQRLVQKNQRMERNVQRRNPASQLYLMHSTANSPESRQTEITTTVETEMETVITEDGRTISVRHSTASFVRVRSGSVQCVRSVSVRLRRQRILK